MARGRVLLALTTLLLALALATGGQAVPARPAGVDLAVTVTVSNGNARTVLRTPQGSEITDHRIAPYSWMATFDFAGIPEQGDFTLEGTGSGKASWTADSSRTVSVGDQTPACHAVVVDADGQLGAQLVRANGQLAFEVSGEFSGDECEPHSPYLVFPELLFRIFRPDAQSVEPLRIALQESALKGSTLTPALPEYDDHYEYTVEEDGDALVATNAAEVHVTTECRAGSACGRAVTLTDDRFPEPPPEPPQPVGRVLVQVSGNGSVATVAPRALQDERQVAQINCGIRGYTCYAEAQPGGQVTMRATPGAGQRFQRWSGACTGGNPVCTVAAQAATSVGAVFGSAKGGTVAASLAPPRISVRWLRSVGKGTLVASGSLGTPGTVRLQLRRARGGPLLTKILHARAGTFTVRAALARGRLAGGATLLPGGFVVSLTGSARGWRLPLQIRTLSVAAPAEGVVRRAFLSTTRGGPPVRRLRHGVREVWATFQLAAQPTAVPVTVSCYAKGRLLGTRTKSNRPVLETGIGAPAGLTAGSYRVDLKAGGRVVQRLNVRLL